MRAALSWSLLSCMRELRRWSSRDDEEEAICVMRGRAERVAGTRFFSWVRPLAGTTCRYLLFFLFSRYTREHSRKIFTQRQELHLFNDREAFMSYLVALPV
jgi:hypothetical protein